MEFEIVLILLGALFIALLVSINLTLNYLAVARNLKAAEQKLIDHLTLILDLYPTKLLEIQKQNKDSKLPVNDFYKLRAEAYKNLNSLEIAWGSFLKAEKLIKAELVPALKSQQNVTSNLVIQRLTELHSFVHDYNEQILTLHRRLEGPIFKLFNRLILRLDPDQNELIEK